MLSIASSSFLIAITQREQVAQIFGKAVYVVTDVAFLPLSSRQEVVQAISAAIEAHQSDEAGTNSELSESDTEAAATPADTDKTSSSPTDDEQSPPQSRPDTSIAQDVFVNRGQFGRVASQWFSRQGWGIGKVTGKPQAVAASADKTAELADGPATTVPAGGDHQIAISESVTGKHALAPTASPDPTPVVAMIPKILRVSRLLLASSRSFFFSYDVDLTRSMASLGGIPQAPMKGKIDALVCTILLTLSTRELTWGSISGIGVSQHLSSKPARTPFCCRSCKASLDKGPSSSKSHHPTRTTLPVWWLWIMILTSPTVFRMPF